MCLIAFAIGAHPSVPLLIASNRDEFFDRPTAPLHRWALPNGVDVTAGRDLRDGGTWLGLSGQGRVAMLTNVRSARMEPAARSRGELANRWLAGEMDWAQLLSSLAPADYGGFNLVVGDAHLGLWGWISNRNPANPHGDEPPALFSRRLPSGLYGVSNATLDTGWPKTLRLKQALSEALHPALSGDPDAALLRALGDKHRVAANEQPETGVPSDWERSLSSPFVDMPERGYGTRTSLLVRASKVAPTGLASLGWRVTMDEWTHGKEPEERAVWRDGQRASATLDW